MDPNGVPTLSFEVYLNNQEERIRKQEEKTLNYYIQELSEEFISNKLVSKRERANTYARGILQGTADFYENASIFSPIDEEIKKTKKAFDKSKQQAFLLINAPTSLKREKKTQAQEEEMRKLQYDSFSKACPGLNNQTADKTEVTVYTKEEIFHAVDQFMEKVKSEKKQNFSIIFNGHGGKGGLVVENKDTKKLERIPLDDFNKHVNVIYGNAFPTTGRIVYAQCYGHKYNTPKVGEIAVINFTSEQKPTTRNFIDTKQGVFEHVQLQEFAEKEQEMIDEALNKNLPLTDDGIMKIMK